MQLIIEKLGKGIGMGWSKRKTVVVKPYEKENQKPVIKASICNGEQVAGFKDIHTGKIEEIMLIKCPEDMERFKEIYGMRGSSEMHLFVQTIRTCKKVFTKQQNISKNFCEICF